MKNIKKLLAALCAIAMVMGTMGTAVLAEDAAEVTIKMTTANADSGIIVAGSKWENEVASGKVFDYYYTAPENMGRFLTVYPGKAGLQKGFYQVYQLTRTNTVNGKTLPPKYKYNFYGKLSADAAKASWMGSEIVAVGAGATTNGNRWQYVGNYSFNGTTDEYIQIGIPVITNNGDQMRVYDLKFVPITSKAVTKNYTISRTETLEMPMPLGTIGELGEVTYEIISCDSHIGNINTENDKFIYTPPTDEEVTEDSFVIKATNNGCKITLTVNVSITDDNAVYIDDADGTAIGTYVSDVPSEGLGDGYKLIKGDSGFNWAIPENVEGVYEAFFYKIGKAGFDPTQRIIVKHNGITENLGISGLDDGKEGWVSLGVFDFSGSGDEFIETSRKNGGQAYSSAADCVKLVPVTEIVNKKISVFENSVYKEGALLTYGREDSGLAPVSVTTPSNGTVDISGNDIIYTPSAAGNDSFSVECEGGYTINYGITVSAVPSVIVAEASQITDKSGVKGGSIVGYSATSVYANDENAYLKYAIPSGTAGYYQAEIWKVATTTATKDAAGIEVKSAGGTKVESFVQKGLSYAATDTATGEWIPMGIYCFDGEGEEYIKIFDLERIVDGLATNTAFEYFRFGGIRLVPVSASNISAAKVSEVEYYPVDDATAIETLPASGEDVTSKFTLTNTTAQGNAVTVLNAIYNNDVLESVYLEMQYLAPYSVKKMDAIAKVPAAATGDDYKIRTFIWDSLTRLNPLTGVAELD